MRGVGLDQQLSPCDATLTHRPERAEPWGQAKTFQGRHREAHDFIRVRQAGQGRAGAKLTLGSTPESWGVPAVSSFLGCEPTGRHLLGF